MEDKGIKRQALIINSPAREDDSSFVLVFKWSSALGCSPKNAWQWGGAQRISSNLSETADVEKHELVLPTQWWLSQIPFIKGEMETIFLDTIDFA